jgi:hypothetical protein
MEFGVSDKGARSAVTGGAQMNGIISLISESFAKTELIVINLF